MGGRRDQGRGKEWTEQELGLSIEVVQRTPRPIPEKIAMKWSQEWAKEGNEIDWNRLLPRRGFEVLPRCWVVERILAWLSQNRRMAKDNERLCATTEAFVYPRDESADGKALSTCLGFIGQSLETVWKYRIASCWHLTESI